MTTPAAVRTGNLEGAYIQAWVDLLLQNDAGFPTTPQDILDAGGNDLCSVSDRDFKYALAGWIILGRVEVDPAFDCLDELTGTSGDENLSLAESIDAVIAAIQVGDPGYDGTWQTLAPLANEFASVPHRVRRGCILYCASQYLVQTGGSATLTEAIAAGCCCGTMPLYQAVAVLSAIDGGLPPPVSDPWPPALNTNLILRVESTDFDANLDLDPVSAWNDKSGNLNHMTSQGAAYDPWVDQVNTLNGHATLKFITSTQRRHLRNLAGWNGDPASWSAAEVLAIMYKNSDPPVSDAGAPFKFAGGGTTDSHVPFIDGVVYENFADATRPASTNPATSFNQWLGYWIRATKVSGTQCARVQIVGSETVENKAGGGVWSDPKSGPAVAVGISYQGLYTPPTYPHLSMDGNLAAIYLWAINLSGAQRSALSSYINTLWGLTIPTS